MYCKPAVKKDRRRTQHTPVYSIAKNAGKFKKKAQNILQKQKFFTSGSDRWKVNFILSGDCSLLLAKLNHFLDNHR